MSNNESGKAAESPGWATAEHEQSLQERVAVAEQALSDNGIDASQFRAEVYSRLEEKGLTDDILFGVALTQNPEFTRKLLEAILHIPLGKCTVARQHWEHPALTARHSARFDVLVTSENSIVAIFEMENQLHNATVPRALTYLSTLVTSSSVTGLKDKQQNEAGSHTRLSHFPINVAVVFLVKGNPFPDDKVIHTFEFMNTDTGEVPDNILFRSTFIDIDGDLTQIKDHYLQEVLANFQIQQDSSTGRMIKRIIAQALTSKVAKMTAFYRDSMETMSETVHTLNGQLVTLRRRFEEETRRREEETRRREEDARKHQEETRRLEEVIHKLEEELRRRDNT